MITMKYFYRYNNLTEPAIRRSSLLQRSLTLHQFLRDVQDQLRWLQEKQRMAESDEVGSDLLGNRINSTFGMLTKRKTKFTSAGRKSISKLVKLQSLVAKCCEIPKV